jgi:hypothetical protein
MGLKSQKRYQVVIYSLLDLYPSVKLVILTVLRGPSGTKQSIGFIFSRLVETTSSNTDTTIHYYYLQSCSLEGPEKGWIE